MTVYPFQTRGTRILRLNSLLQEGDDELSSESGKVENETDSKFSQQVGQDLTSKELLKNFKKVFKEYPRFNCIKNLGATSIRKKID